MSAYTNIEYLHITHKQSIYLYWTLSWNNILKMSVLRWWHWLNTTRLPEQIATEDKAQHKDEETNAKNDDIDVQGEGVCDVWGHGEV